MRDCLKQSLEFQEKRKKISNQNCKINREREVIRNKNNSTIKDPFECVSLFAKVNLNLQKKEEEENSET